MVPDVTEPLADFENTSPADASLDVKLLLLSLLPPPPLLLLRLLSSPPG